MAFLFMLPLIWLVGNSLRQAGYVSEPHLDLFPSQPVWSNYTQVFDLYPIGRQLLNSLLVVALAVPLTLITASWAGYAMAQLPSNARRRLILFSILLLIVPLSAMWLPRFMLFTSVGLNDNLLSLVTPALMGSNPFYILLFYWTYRRLPPDLFESARLEGAGDLLIWRRLALPLARPTLAVVAVLSFTLYWSDYITPLMYLRSEALYTFSLRLQMFTQQDNTKQPYAMAATVIAIAPVVLLFLLVQRYFWPEGRKGLL
jgi:multiple sugar transport system permease protein